MRDTPPGVPIQQSAGTGCPHVVMSVLVWEMGTWIWGCQTLRDPPQLPLSSSKAGHTPSLPGGEPARSPPESSATLEDIWSPGQMGKDQKKRERASDMNGVVDEQGQAAEWGITKPCRCFLVTRNLFGGRSEMKTQKQPLQKAEQSGPSLPFSSSWWA